MTTNPDQSRRQHEAETGAALALLLAQSKRRYSLPALIAQKGIKPRAWRPIQPTSALKYDMAAPYYDITRAWASVADDLLRAYTTGNAATVQAAVDRAATAIDRIVQTAQQRFVGVTSRIEAWHRAQWLQRVRTTTGLDISFLTTPSDVSNDAAATVTWNKALASDVHSQIKSRIAVALLGALATQAPAAKAEAKARAKGSDAPVQRSAAEMIADAVAKGEKRAAAIGDDQVDKLSRGMDRARRAAAGIDQFAWFHTPQKHPRDWHLARNGRVFSEGDIDAGDRAGVPPFCKCYEIPVWQ